MSTAATQILQAAAAGVTAVEEHHVGLDDYLDYQLTAPEFRRTVSHILFSYFRRRMSIHRSLNQLMRRSTNPSLRHLLEAALTQIRYCDGIAPGTAINVAVSLARRTYGRGDAGFVSAVLHRASMMPSDAERQDAPEDVLPPPIMLRWTKRYTSEELHRLKDAFITPADTVFRCHRARELTASEMTTFDAQAVALPSTERTYWCFYKASSPARVLNSQDWNNGRFYFQDPAAAFIMSLPDYTQVSSALDVCCAPGGKAMMIAEMLPGDGMLVASDRSESRQALTRDNFRRHGLEHFPVLIADAWDIPEEWNRFDLVAADVPCSNTGVFRRRPDALWRFHPDQLHELTRLQQKILAAAASRVRHGGQLLYSTCSLEPEENEKNIAQFLAKNTGFRMATEKRIFPSAEHDGGYGCLLRRFSLNSILT